MSTRSSVCQSIYLTTVTHLFNENIIVGIIDVIAIFILGRGVCVVALSVVSAADV